MLYILGSGKVVQLAPRFIEGVGLPQFLDSFAEERPFRSVTKSDLLLFF